MRNGWMAFEGVLFTRIFYCEKAGLQILASAAGTLGHKAVDFTERQM